jgi:hypothetical protein
MRLASRDVAASAFSVRILLDLLPTLVTLLAGVAILLWLHAPVTILLALLALPFGVASRHLLGSVADVAQRFEDPDSRRELRRILSEAASATEPTSGSGHARLAGHQALRFEALRLADRGNLLAESFGAVALVSLLLALGPSSSDPAQRLADFVAYLVVLRAVVASFRGGLAGASRLARLWPGIDRHYRAVVHGFVLEDAGSSSKPEVDLEVALGEDEES